VPETPVPGAKPVGQDPVWHVRKVLASTRNYETVALDLLGRGLDVVGVYFEGIDLVAHRFQHCMPPRMAICNEADYAMQRSAVTAFYEYQDEILGRILRAAPGRTVMIVSDHGFRSGSDRPADFLPYTTGQPVEWHREYGLFVLSGPGSRRGVRFEGASVYDVTPTLLYLSGLPASGEMPGRLLEEALDPGPDARRPPARIASWEDVGPPREIPEAVASPEAQEEMIANLQALGYVGAVAPGRPGPESAQAGQAGRPGDGGETGGGVGAAAAPGAPGETTRVTYHRNLATHFLKSGRLDEAEAQLVQANEIQPLPKSYELLSEIRASRGDLDGAVSYLTQGLERFPEMDQDAVLWIVALRLRQGRADLAEEALVRWRARVTREALLATCEGKLALARGEQERALALFLEALGSEPNLAQAAIAAAPLLDARGRLAELEPSISRALGAERRLDEYQNILGLIRLRQGRSTEALQAIGLALEVDPSNPRFLENYAAAALAAGRANDAIARYRAGLEDPRAGGAAWAGYGRLLGIGGRPAEAASAFRKALDLGDRAPATFLGYATALLQTGADEASRAAVREGLRSHPEDAALLALQRRLG